MVTRWAGILFYEAKEIESSLPDPASGMKNIGIDFTFEILDTMAYEMIPEQHFSLLDGKESYRSTNFSVIEAIAWENERQLNGYRGGKLHAIVPDAADSYGLQLKISTLVNVIMIRFD